MMFSANNFQIKHSQKIVSVKFETIFCLNCLTKQFYT